MCRDFNLSSEEVENDDFLAAQEEERAEFQNKLRERMLRLGLDEVDLSEVPNQKESEVTELQSVSGFNALLSNQKESEMTEAELQDLEEGKQEWSREYDRCIDNPPGEGDILTTLEGDKKVLLVKELNEGSPPFIYARAYVPEIVGQPLGWYLQSGDSQSFHGWKCILLPRARTELIRKFGLQQEKMEVESLKVIRPSQSGKSLLCEIHKYGDEEEKKEEERTVMVVNPADSVATVEEGVVQEPEVTVEKTDVQEPEVTVESC